MTKEEIDLILREVPTQGSDFAEPSYKVWQREPVYMLIMPKTVAAEALPLFLARMLVRELQKRDHDAWIEVE